MRYGDFSIFQDGGGRQLRFMKFRMSNGRNGQEGGTASSCQPNFVEIAQTAVWADKARAAGRLCLLPSVRR